MRILEKQTNFKRTGINYIKIESNSYGNNRRGYCTDVLKKINSPLKLFFSHCKIVFERCEIDIYILTVFIRWVSSLTSFN